MVGAALTTHQSKPLAVVIASAGCWESDLKAFTDVYRAPFDVIAVNDGGWLYPHRVDHWVTLHPEHMARWVGLRGNRDGIQMWTSADRGHRDRNYDWNTVGHWGPGSSSLFAVTVAWYMGYERVVLCGAPMQSMPHAPGASEWNGDPWPEHEVRTHREGWLYHKQRIGGMVRSMSGWTAEQFGFPDAEFLYDRWPGHQRMAKQTVRPPVTAGGIVTEAYWHCPACGSTKIHAIQRQEGEYHCGDCGRDYAVAICPLPWYHRDPRELAERYPPDLLPIG